jgi:citrate synthase
VLQRPAVKSNIDIRIAFSDGRQPGQLINRLHGATRRRVKNYTSQESFMRVGKQDAPYTAISTSDAHTITVRGKNLCTELIGEIGFTDYFYFLVTGEMPTDNQRFFTDAVLCAIAEHGLVPSNQAARMTLAAAPDALQGAVAAGILGCGSVVLGSTEACGRWLVELVGQARESGQSFEEVARAALREMRAARRAVPGYGHPQHSSGDPRTERLLALAAGRNIVGDHIRMLHAVEKVIPEIYPRALPINVSGAIPAVMLDVGYPVEALKGIPILARTASLIGHLHEEMHRPIGFVLSHHAAKAIEYDGPAAQSGA